MAWENTATVITGDLITAAQWNRDRNNQEWLARDHWRARMERTTDQTGIVDSTFTKVNWTSIPYDFGSLASTVNDEFTIPTFPSGITTGLFAIYGFVFWDSNSTGSRVVEVFINGVRNGGTNDTGIANKEHSIYQEHELIAGDTVDLRVFQTSGANRTLLGAGAGPLRMTIRWLAWQD